MSNSDIEQAGTVKGHIPNGANLSGRISNVVSLSGHISIGSGAGDFIIKMTIEENGSEFIVTSCDTTVEQIDEAVAAEKRVVVVASVDGTILELPMVQGNKGNSYYFCAILSESVLLSSVYKIENTSDWSFGMIQIRDITAEDVSYHDSFELGFENVGQTLDALVTGVNETRKDVLRLNKSEHTHSNKSVLDKFSETDGKPTYNGTAIGGSGASSAENVSYTNENLEGVTTVKGALDGAVDAFLEYNNMFEYMGNELNQKVSLSDITPESIGAKAVTTKVSTGDSFSMNDNTEYRLTNVTTLTLYAPHNRPHYECWFSLTFANSGTITVTLPTDMKYIGSAPDFNNGESWEMSIKDGVVIAQKIGDGT